jgi:hypothetical protein
MSQPTHDVFISYAHRDDQKLPEADYGWVTLFVDHLKARVTTQLKGRESLKCWMDHQLAGNAELTPTILETVRGSATILIFLSPQYLASKWCRDELETFMAAARTRGRATKRIFLIEVWEVSKPPALEDLKGYQFWQIDPHSGVPELLGYPRPSYDRHPDYYRLLNQLAYNLAEEINRQHANGDGGPAEQGRPVVYLAEATDDLEANYAEMKSYLEQSGLRVVPGDYLPRAPDLFRGAVLGELADAKLFVQLLSGVHGKRPPGLPVGYVGLQHQLAVEQNIPVMQWRSRDLDVAKVADPAHRALLEGVTVASESITEFKKRVVQAGTAPPRPQKRTVPAEDRFVFINAERADRPWAVQLCQLLKQFAVGFGLPVESPKLEVVQQSIEHHLMNCDAAILVYGSTPASWVTEQVHRLRRLLTRRMPKPIIAVLELPPAPKDQLNVQLHYLREIRCHDGVCEAELKSFLDGLPVAAPEVEADYERAHV